ncbi:MAG: hypothetical protein DI523_16465 [Paraburkholderia fungorum]|nr:MAG: hypothetical protein DI523_16465 [Paraburkholderia fungorum]
MILLVGVVLMLGLVNANPVAHLAFTACSATKTTVAFSFLAAVLIDGFLRRNAGPRKRYERSMAAHVWHSLSKQNRHG